MIEFLVIIGGFIIGLLLKIKGDNLIRKNSHESSYKRGKRIRNIGITFIILTIVYLIFLIIKASYF